MPLPHHYLITPAATDEAAFLATLEKCLQAGTQLLYLKPSGLNDAQYRALAAKVIPLAHRYDCQVLLSGEPALVAALGADGLHLDNRALADCTTRPLMPFYLLAASAHTTEDIRAAEALGASFVVLSPINATSAHPDIEPLGWQGLREMVEQCAVPIYALGGVSASDEAAAREAGGQGIAGHRGYWPA